MEPANDIFRRHNTDKWSPHYYGRFYDELFASQEARDAVRAVLEIGIASGNSLRAWREMFPGAAIVGFDCTPQMPPPIPDRIEIHTGDQDNRRALLKAVASRQFDMIVDDASHRLEHQLKSMFLLWPALRPGGFYVVEEFDWLSPDRVGTEPWPPCLTMFANATARLGGMSCSQFLVLRKEAACVTA